jgi:high affinity Mn2+ porin
LSRVYVPNALTLAPSTADVMRAPIGFAALCIGSAGFVRGRRTCRRQPARRPREASLCPIGRRSCNEIGAYKAADDRAIMSSQAKGGSLIRLASRFLRAYVRANVRMIRTASLLGGAAPHRRRSETRRHGWAGGAFLISIWRAVHSGHKMRYARIIVFSAVFATHGATVRASEFMASGSSAVQWDGLYFGSSFGANASAYRSERLQAVAGFGFPANAFDLYPSGADRAGLTFGMQAGYNCSYGPFVYGFETGLNFVGGQRDPNGFFPTTSAYQAFDAPFYSLAANTSGNYFASLGARFGFVLRSMLFYGGVGVATGGWRGSSILTFAGDRLGSFSSPMSQSSRMKHVLSAGIEYALDRNWSLRAEYLFLNQQLQTQIFSDGRGTSYASRSRNESHVLRLGMNYHFADASDGSSKQSDDAKPDASERLVAHGQITELPQGYPKFPARYSGAGSLEPPAGQVRATTSITGSLGLSLWEGAEAFVTPELDQGYGLNSTHGVAGFPNVEAYKLGAGAPYLRLHKYFLRQIIGLGGGSERINAGFSQLGRTVDANRLTFTVGKYSAVDIFDDNKYAHDGRNGFMNWSILDMGAFDYAADSWGFTHGATVEWKQDWWTARAGVFQLPLTPNGPVIEPSIFRQFSPIVELEARHALFFCREGKIRILGFDDFAYVGKWDDATNIGLATGTTPDVSIDRRVKRSKAGGGIDIEQSVTNDLGFFIRASLSNGRYETAAFTEIDRSLAAGLALEGAFWGRPKDGLGVAAVVNGASGSHLRYLENGGQGAMLGDGGLTPGGEHVFEAYYKLGLFDGAHLTGDYQFVDNPGYNRQRGPVSIFALRLHSEF